MQVGMSEQRDNHPPPRHTRPWHLTGEAPEGSVMAVGMWLESRDMKMFVFGKVQAESRRATQEERSLGAARSKQLLYSAVSLCCLLATLPDGSVSSSLGLCFSHGQSGDE